jgi:RimJ/RimL family protein N-acetyltransferase
MTMLPPRPSFWGTERDSMLIMASRWVGRKVRLREVEAADRNTLVRFDRDSTRSSYPWADGYRHWAAHRANSSNSGDDLHLAIETRDGVLVGSMCTTQTEPVEGRFSYGIGIGPQFRRRGYADDAISVQLAFMFWQRGYRKCEVGIYACNQASLSLHRRLGFREEGRIRDPEALCGGAQYLVLMALTEREFSAYVPLRAAVH